MPQREPSDEERDALAALVEAQRAYDEAWRALRREQEQASWLTVRPRERLDAAQERVLDAGRRLREAGERLRAARRASR